MKSVAYPGFGGVLTEGLELLDAVRLHVALEDVQHWPNAVVDSRQEVVHPIQICTRSVESLPRIPMTRTIIQND